MMKSLKGRVLCGLVGIAGLAAAPAAHADRVLTEHEAGKLTFSSLIAPPSAFRHVARKALSHDHSARMRLASSRQHHAVVVRDVAYHGHVVNRHRLGTHRHRG